ncbi:MAG: addiction module protein [Porticoccaceae bacterium]
MVDAALISQVKTLSPAERLELIGAVWETLSPADMPVTEEERVLLDTRLADLENNPDDQTPWSEVQARLRRQLS